METRHASCCLCEAACGLEVDVDGDRVLAVRGDQRDPLSRGHLCPKGAALRDLHHDPDRLRTPLVRVGDRFEPIGWDAALDLAADRLHAARAADVDAVALYAGNPTAHDAGAVLYGLLLQQVLATRSWFTAQSVDALPRLLVSFWVFGNQALVPVPDLERTHHLVVLGANPAVSNGSAMRSPDVKRRLKELRERGGRLVVIDPRRTETARLADEHHALLPGTDALLLLAWLHVLFARGHVRPRADLCDAATLASLEALARPWTPERVAGRVGIDAATITRLADEFGRAPSAVLYGRMGTCVQEFGTLSTWLLDVIHVVTGNLDSPGGVMFGTHPADLPRIAAWLGQRGAFDRWRSPVDGLPEFNGELPAAAMAGELESGRIRALLTHAGNPVLSLPNGARVERALAKLDFYVAVDIYVNETTRHAHLILPSTFGLENPGFALVNGALAVRNHARWDEPSVPPAPEARRGWWILHELSRRLLQRRGLGGRLAAGVLAGALGAGPERVLDVLLRLGPYRMRLSELKAAPHGLDLGPLVPRLPEMLGTRTRRLELVPDAIPGEIERVARRLEEPVPELVLVGRRDLRTNNSWMHNVQHLARGKRRCTLLVHPEDAARRGVRDGEPVRIVSRVGAVVATAEVSDEVRPGVVSLPHGWGHGRPGTRLSVANAHAGVSVNDLTDDRLLDGPSGNAAVNGVPVTLEPVP